MLGGIDPVLVLQLSAVLDSPVSGLSGVPVLGAILPTAGVPIPIYLSELGTGIYVESESTQVSIATNLKYTNKGDLLGDQQVSQNSLTINLIGKRSAPLLAVLLAFIDVMLTRLVQKSYAITYVNGPIVVFNGLIEDFSQQADRNSELVRMTLVISRGKSAASALDQSVPNVSLASTGPRPVPLAFI